MRLILITFLFLYLFISTPASGQENQEDSTILFIAAQEIINHSRFCALITLDKYGHPQTRTMEPFPPEENFILTEIKTICLSNLYLISWK